MSTTTTSNHLARTTHSHAGSLYLLPSDDEERQRLIVQHKVYTRILSGRLIIPPISFSDEDEVLDIGTGAGTWLCDVRAHLPKAVHLYGIDIESRLFPAPSDNVHLSVCSATDLPSSWTSKFALVHQRLLICAYTRDQWRRSVAEMYRVLAPGGYAQMIEIHPECRSGPKTAAHLLFVDDFLASKGMMWHCSIFIADMLTAAGFVEVTSEEVTMDLGKWAGEDGVRARDARIGAWRGMRDAVMKANGLGRFASAEAFDKALDEVKEEWDSIQGSYAKLYMLRGTSAVAPLPPPNQLPWWFRW